MVTYDEVEKRVFSVYRGADEIDAAPTLLKARQALVRFERATVVFQGLLGKDLSKAGGNKMFFLIAESWKAFKAFAFYHSAVIDDTAYCEAEANGDEAVQQSCLRRLFDPNEWDKSFRDLFDAGGKVLGAIPE